MDIGRTIKLLRIAAGFKQKDLAHKVGVSPNYLSLVESGKREPSLSFLKAVAKSLEIPLGFLFIQAMGEPDTLSAEQKEIYRRLQSILFDLQALLLERRREQKRQRK